MEYSFFNPIVAVVAIAIAGVAVAIYKLYWAKRPKKSKPVDVSPPIDSVPAEYQKAADVKECDVIPNKTGKYRAVVWRRSSELGDPVISFERIDKPAGPIFWAEPSLPESGMTYMLREKAEGGFEPYDPREVAIINEETPQMAYFATNWDIVSDVYLYVRSLWDQISPILVWVIVIIFFIIALVALD